MGRAEGIAAIGGVFGQILAAMGQTEEARAVLGQSAEALRLLGRGQEAEQVEAQIRDLPPQV